MTFYTLILVKLFYECYTDKDYNKIYNHIIINLRFQKNIFFTNLNIVLSYTPGICIYFNTLN